MASTRTPLRVLVIEDSEDDALLILHELKRGSLDATWERVETAAALTEALERRRWDAILCDWVMPRLSAPVALEIIRRRGFGGPIIIVSGNVGEEVVADAMRDGAHDYVSKHKLARLVPALQRELREAEERHARRRAEEALREGEIFLKQVADTIDDVCWITDREDHRVLFASSAYERIWGRSLQSLYESPTAWADAIHPDDRERAWNTFVHLEQEVTYDEEYRVVRPDGSIRWVRDRGFPIRDASGRIYRVAGIARDITQGKGVEDALLESEERLALATRSAQVGVWDWRVDTGEVYMDPVSKRALGFEDHEIQNTIQDWCGRVHSRDIEATMAAMLAHFEGKTPQYEIEHRLVHRDGSARWVLSRGTALREPGGRPYRITGSTMDITERKRADKALRKSERTLGLVLENGDGGVWDLDLRTREVYFNPGWIARLGYTVDEVPPHASFWENLMPPEDLLKVQEAARAHFEGRTPVYESENRLRTKSGTWRWILNRGKIVEWAADGTPVRVVGMHTDISERKRAEEEIARLNADLELRVTERTAELAAANKELDAFSYSVSHDLRAPLRAIDGFSEAVQEECASALSDQGKAYLQRVRAAAQHMGRLINHLLRLSQVTRAEMHCRLVDLSALAREIAAELQATEPARQVTFVLADTVVVEGDPTLLRAVMENLLGNAWKYTRKRAQAHIEFASTPNDGSRAYFVRDNGAGFDMTYANQLFGAFQRLHTPDEFEGTGIGLATVQRIIQRHWGQVWAEGAVDQGATFYFTLGGERR